MAAQEDSQGKRLVVKPDEETRVALEKARAEIEAALARTKEEARARLKAEAALTEAQQALVAVQTEVEQKRQAGLKIERAKAAIERALAQARQTTETEPEGTEPPPTALGEGGAERRVTFIVRLTVDERNQPRRTEVEHAQSGHKKTVPGLDPQRLIAFMKACLNLSNYAGTDDLPAGFDNQSG